jgi:hypothetical protein
MQGFLVKPIGSVEIAHMLTQTFPGREAESPVARPRSRVANVDSSVFNTQEFTLNYNGAETVATEIVELFLKQSQQLYDDARTALARGDAEAFHAGIHRLKGAAGIIGCTRVVAAADAILVLSEADMKKKSTRLGMERLADSFNRELGLALVAVAAYSESTRAR